MLKKILLILISLSFLSLNVSGSEKLSKNLKELSKKGEPYTFIVLGDNRSGDNIYKKLITMMMVHKPDFVVNTGDLIVTPGSLELWGNFKKMSEQITAPYFLAIGNHDVDDKESQKIWQQEVDLPGNELYYSWMVGNSLFVVLDSCEAGNYYKVSGEQLDWLKRTLNPQKYKRQFVFLHHPLYLRKGMEHYGRSVDRYPDLRDKLQNLFEEKKVTAVFVGHEHAYAREKVGGVWHIITGGGGAPIYDKSFCHFMIVNVDGDKIKMKVIDREGVVQDEFQI